ncbi:MAG TPA: ferrous iron transport protein A [Sulfuricurvum sp.]|jgi:ferrous iron transport protein A|nr:ferrous iron transport protein A [Sulfuricurvum sp.]
MCLLQMKVGEMASVDAVNVHGALRARLSAMGMTRDAEICVKHFGWFKSTVQVMINRTLVALRREEAEQIEVHKI